MNNNIKEVENDIKKGNFNLIDIFAYMSLLYSSSINSGNVVSLIGFTLSSIFRFISKD